MRGITLEKLKEKGWVRLNHPTPYQPFLERFETDSGKFEFRSEKAEVDGFGLYPCYVPPYEAADDSMPANQTLEAEKRDQTVALLAVANNFLLNSMFANSPDHTKAGEPLIVVSPVDAASFELTDNSMME